MLIKNFAVNTEEAIRIHKLAYRNALAEVNDPSKVGADQIAEALAKLLTPFFKTLDIDHHFQRYHNALYQWDASHEARENQVRCAQVQHVALVLLKEQSLLNKYKKLSNDYSVHLKDSLLREIRSIHSKEILEKIYKIVIHTGVSSGKPLDGSTTAEIKNKIFSYLQNQSTNDEMIKKLEEKNLFSENTIQAIKKHGVIINAINILNDSEDNPLKFRNFYHHLNQNKKHLMIIRNDNLVMKSFGVFAATIFGLGISGFFAYRELFHNSHGSRYLDKVNRAQPSRFKPK